MELNYTNPTASLGGTALYNGNISEKKWKTVSDNIERYYTFNYDKLSRLTQAYYNEKQPGQNVFSNTDRYKEGSITYDKNGNILTLTRSGFRSNSTYGIMDQLTYAYNGNQLNTIAETATVQGYNDFKDGNTSGSDYIYDPNGNTTDDKNKGTVVAYNRLNLPQLVTFSGNRSIEYTYDAIGMKQQKKVNNNGSITNTWYCGNFIYNDQGFDYLFTQEGRIVNNGAATPPYRYEYQYKDHLGNATLAYSDLDNNGSINSTTEIIQQTTYYPFGLDFYGTNYSQIGPVNPYKYNGKELQSDFGLNWYDYGARFYDPVSGRWITIDPLAEKYMSVSPFIYCINNPMNLIDIDGREVFDSDDVLKRRNKPRNTSNFSGRTMLDKALGIDTRGKYFRTSSEGRNRTNDIVREDGTKNPPTARIKDKPEDNHNPLERVQQEENKVPSNRHDFTPKYNEGNMKVEFDQAVDQDGNPVNRTVEIGTVDADGNEKVISTITTNEAGSVSGDFKLNEGEKLFKRESTQGSGTSTTSATKKTEAKKK